MCNSDILRFFPTKPPNAQCYGALAVLYHKNNTWINPQSYPSFSKHEHTLSG